MAIAKDKMQLSLVMDKATHIGITQSAKSSGVSINALINLIIKDYLNKNKPIDTLHLLTMLNTSSANKVLLMTTLDKVITTPTKKNYDKFIKMLNGSLDNKEITQDIYDGLLNMANVIPIKDEI